MARLKSDGVPNTRLRRPRRCSKCLPNRGSSRNSCKGSTTVPRYGACRSTHTAPCVSGLTVGLTAGFAPALAFEGSFAFPPHFFYMLFDLLLFFYFLLFRWAHCFSLVRTRSGRPSPGCTSWTAPRRGRQPRPGRSQARGSTCSSRSARVVQQLRYLLLLLFSHCTRLSAPRRPVHAV